MPDEQPVVPERARYANEETVLDLLLGDQHQRPWTLHELALDIGSRELVEDAIDSLHAAGLVHKPPTATSLPAAPRSATTKSRDEDASYPARALVGH